MTFHAKGGIIPILSTNDSPHKSHFNYSVSIYDINGQSAFSSTSETNREEVEQWCDHNLSHGHHLGGYEAVFFVSEDDAILFWMKFKK